MFENYYITTDTHLGHDNIIKYCNRPKNHEELILKYHDSINTIKNESQQNNHYKDILIHLGDVFFGKTNIYDRFMFRTKDWKKRILVKGNHDRKSYNWYLNSGWDFVCERFDIFYSKKRISFSHEPIKMIDFFDYNIHGHCHNILKNDVGTDKHILISLEYMKYRPHKLDEILNTKNLYKMKDSGGNYFNPFLNKKGN